MYEFLVRLVVALLFVVAAVMIGRSFFRLTDNSFESFNEINAEINSMEEGIEAKKLVLDEHTALLGFLPNEEMIKVTYPLSLDIRTKLFLFKRPPSCHIDKACLCLCTKIKKEEYDEKQSTEDYECTEYSCKNYDTMIFKDEMCLDKEENCVKSVEGGYAAINALPYDYKGHSETNDPRTRSIYIENYKGTKGICWIPPCISDEKRKFINDKQNLPKSCEIDSTCKVTNSPCSCNTLGSSNNPSIIPEICIGGQYCYEGISGCENTFIQQDCLQTNPKSQDLEKCEIDKYCMIQNYPCTCTSWGGKKDICTSENFCYTGKSGCQDNPNMQYCQQINSAFEEPPACDNRFNCEEITSLCKCQVGTGDNWNICTSGQYCYHRTFSCQDEIVEDYCQKDDS
ncbi:hypothetical protein GF336_07025 [Candidatus Woesearchaeota archaeon]|nr:hypothetical protein [Candidatus Woesearchaeota archaeon]